MNTREATELLSRNTIILMRDDFNSALHPRMFDEICEQLGHDPKTTDELTLTISKSKAD